MTNGLLSALGAWRARRSAEAQAALGGIEGIMTGYFEYRSGRVAGWVEDRRGPPRGPISIRAVQHGQILLACEVEKPGGDRRFKFSMDIGTICTGADLVNEDVKIVARNLRGDSGTLVIDGGNALELIRDVAGVPATTVFDLSFARDGNARPYLGRGWSGPEDEFTWTEGQDSFVTLPNSRELGTYALRMSAGAAIRKPEVTSQLLQVFIDKHYVSQFILQFDHVQFMECKLPGELLLSSDITTLRLHHPDAVRPSDLTASKDHRLLAFRFKRLSLARLHEPNSD